MDCPNCENHHAVEVLAICDNPEEPVTIVTAKTPEDQNSSIL